MSELTLKQANTIIEKALERARAMKIKPRAVVVLRSQARFRAPANPSG
jgi:hypothetical protein